MSDDAVDLSDEFPEDPCADLVRRSSFASRDEEEVTEFIRRTYADNSSHFLPVVDTARFSALTHDTDAVGADRLRTSIDYDGTSEEGFSDYTFFVVRAGTVHVSTPTGSVTHGPGDVSFYPLHVPLGFEMRGYDVTTLRLPADQVARVAEEATGVRASEVRLHDMRPVSTPMARYWRALLNLTSGALMDRPSPLGSELLADDLARTVATAALRTFPNTTMTTSRPHGPGAVGPAAVRRALAHIEAAAHRPLDLTELAAVAGTSARGLQYAFRRHLGTTPLGHLRRVRLERARRELREADPTRGDTVAVIAARWGWAHPGRFAAAYREAFGVLPGEDLRR